MTIASNINKQCQLPTINTSSELIGAHLPLALAGLRCQPNSTQQRLHELLGGQQEQHQLHVRDDGGFTLWPRTRATINQIKDDWQSNTDREGARGRKEVMLKASFSAKWLQASGVSLWDDRR